MNMKLAIELLGLTHAAQWQTEAELTANPEVMTGVTGTLKTATVNGETVRRARPISRKNFKSDTECFVARSDGDDVVVAFRGSEISLFNESGAFRDWVLTDFRANRIQYPPSPGKWPDQTWVHAGIWQAYELVRDDVMGEVARQIARKSPARHVYVTGFSLGGALAQLAALDIATALVGTRVSLFTFAAPRIGDGSLNKLVASRLAKTWTVGFAGDPIIHLPPLGPNFPINFRHPINFSLAGIHVPMGNPALPQIGQQYQTAKEIVYLERNGEMKSHWPLAQVALTFADHNWGPYLTALNGALRRQNEKKEEAGAQRRGHSEGAVTMLLLS